VEAIGGAGGKGGDDLPLDTGHGTATAVETQPVGGVGRTLVQPPGESWCQDHIGGEAIDIVVDDLTGEHDEADQLGRKVRRRLGGQGLEVRLTRLGERVATEADGLTEVPPGESCRLLRRHHLVGACRIGHPTLGHRYPVLGEVHASVATHLLDVVVVQGGFEGLPVGPGGDDEKIGRAGDVLHMGKVGQLLRQVRREKGTGGNGCLELQVRRIRGGQVGGEGGLGPSGTGDRPHGDAPDKTDEEDDEQVARPPAAQRGPEPVPGDL
jgi:hypothetical protein